MKMRVEDKKKYREEGNVKTARLELCRCKPRNAKDCYQPQRLGRGRGSKAMPTPGFQNFSLQTVKEYISVVLSHPVCGNLLEINRLIF